MFNSPDVVGFARMRERQRESGDRADEESCPEHRVQISKEFEPIRCALRRLTTFALTKLSKIRKTKLHKITSNYIKLHQVSRSGRDPDLGMHEQTDLVEKRGRMK